MNTNITSVLKNYLLINFRNCLIFFLFFIYHQTSFGTIFSAYSLNSVPNTSYNNITPSGTIFSSSDLSTPTGLHIPKVKPWPLGGTFSFNGLPYTSIYVSSNGFICFGGPPSPNDISPLSTPMTGVKGVIAVFAGNISCTSPGSVSYYHSGNQFIIQWSDFQKSPSDHFNFQIELDLGTGNFSLHYGTMQIGITDSVQVGTRGLTPADVDWNNVQSGTTWNPFIHSNNSAHKTKYFLGTILANLDYLWGAIIPKGVHSQIITNTSSLTDPYFNRPQGGTPSEIVNVDLYDVNTNLPVLFNHTVNGVPQAPITMSYDYSFGLYKHYHATLPAIAVQHGEVSYSEHYTCTEGYQINGGDVAFSIGSLKATPTSYAESYNGGTGNIAISHSQIDYDSGLKLRATCSHAPIKITQITTDLYAQGHTDTYPFYLYDATGSLNNKDFVEIRNLSGTPLDISGFIFVFESINEVRTYKIPNNQSLLNASGTLIFNIGFDAFTPDNASHHFYNIGGANNPLSSVDQAGFILKKQDGSIIDAVAVNGFEFDGRQGEVPSNWFGLPVDSCTGKAGFIRNNSVDHNCYVDWIVADSSHKQTIGAPTFPLDSAFSAPLIQWHSATLGDYTGEIITVPYSLSNNGSYDFTTTVTGDSDVATAPLHIVVHPGFSPTANFYADNTNPFINQTITLHDTSTNYPSNWKWTITPSTFVYVNNTNANSANPQIQFTAPGLYSVKLLVGNFDGYDSLSMSNYISVKQVFEQASKFWGMTVNGGDNGTGVIFNMNLDGSTYTKVYSFTNATGRTPNGSLIKASNGLLYGTTVYGGTNGYGVLFSFNPVTYQYADVYNFGANAFDGKYPGASLVQASNGLLYGMTSQGGFGNRGVLFSFNTSTNTYTRLLVFNGSANGANPWHSSLMQANNGLLYGVTSNGGVNNSGVIFSFNTNGNVFTKLHDFNETNCDSKNPDGTLMQASNGLLYGTTMGASSCGAAGSFQGSMYNYSFAYNIFGTVAYFGRDTSEGSFPHANVTEHNGVLFTTTFSSSPGTSSAGAIDSGFDPSGHGSFIFFNDINIGSHPYGGLINASDGMMYGMTFNGGTSDSGVVYQFNADSNTIIKIHDFYSADGANPYANLLELCGSAPAQPGTISVSGGNAKVCPGETRTYAVPFDIGATNYVWTTFDGGNITSGQGTNKITVLFDVAFTSSSIVLSCTAQNDCGSSPTRTLTISRNNPTATIATNGPTTFCSGTNPLTLTANAGTGLTYQWKKGSTNISGATNQSYIPTATSTVYKVVVTNTAGCSKTSTNVSVTVNPLPSATITAQGPTTFCAGGSVVLQANNGTGFTYQWKKGANNIAGASLQNYIATGGGTYKVVVTNTNGCTKLSAGTIVMVNCKSENVSNQADNFTIYPNPSNGEITVTFTDSINENYNLNVIDLFGRVLVDKKVNVSEGSNAITYDLSDFTKGIYILKLQSPSKNFEQRIVIQ